MDIEILKELETGELTEALQNKLGESIMGASILQMIYDGQDPATLYDALKTDLELKGTDYKETGEILYSEPSIVKTLFEKMKSNAVWQWKLDKLYHSTTAYTDDVIAKLDADNEFIAIEIGKYQSMTSDNYAKLLSKYDVEIANQIKIYTS